MKKAAIKLTDKDIAKFLRHFTGTKSNNEANNVMREYSVKHIEMSKLSHILLHFVANLEMLLLDRGLNAEQMQFVVETHAFLKHEVGHVFGVCSEAGTKRTVRKAKGRRSKNAKVIQLFPQQSKVKH